MKMRMMRMKSVQSHKVPRWSCFSAGCTGILGAFSRALLESVMLIWFLIWCDSLANCKNPRLINLIWLVLISDTHRPALPVELQTNIGNAWVWRCPSDMHIRVDAEQLRQGRKRQAWGRWIHIYSAHIHTSSGKRPTCLQQFYASRHHNIVIIAAAGFFPKCASCCRVVGMYAPIWDLGH